MSHSETGAEQTAEQKADEKRKNRARLAAAAALLLMLAAYEMFFEGWLYRALFASPGTAEKFSEREMRLLSDSADTILSRLLGFAAAALAVRYLNVRVFGKCGGKAFLRTLPCFFVALLNPPVLSLFFKNSSLDYSGAKMAWYALTFAAECVAVAAFEETLFRGAVFLTVLENRRGDGKRIFASVAISSAIFAAAHLLNLFTSSPGAVLLQTGYSFLLGGMCAYTLLRTKNISFCVALHAIFNFCGTLTEKFGRGAWDTPAIIAFTCVLGVCTAAWVISDLFRMKKESTDCFYKIAAEAPETA